jgi:hypothetical protein
MTTALPTALARVEAALAAAIRELRVAELVDWADQTRVVEPHAIFRRRDGKRLVHTYQTGRYTRSGMIPNWRNIALTDIRDVFVRQDCFEPRPDYNPDNRQALYRIEVGVPKPQNVPNDAGN